MSVEEPTEGLTVGDLVAAIGVVAGVPEDEEIKAVRVYSHIDRVEFIGTRGVYRTTLDTPIEERQPEGDAPQASE